MILVLVMVGGVVILGIMFEVIGCIWVSMCFVIGVGMVFVVGVLVFFLLWSFGFLIVVFVIVGVSNLIMVLML